MCKRLFLLVSFILLLVGAPSVFGAPIGVFNESEDVGAVGGIGGTRYIATNEYLILAGGSDIWGTADECHYAYNQVSGNVRFEMSPGWDIGGNNDWAKIEAMLRVGLDTGSVTYATASRRGGNHDPGNAAVDQYVELQARSVQNAGMWGAGAKWSQGVPEKIAIQRVVDNGYQLVQSLVVLPGNPDWQVVNTQFVPGLPDQVLMGAAVTSHDNWWMVQARVGNVAYTQNPGLVGTFPSSGAPLPEACGLIPGLRIETIKAGVFSNLDAGYDAAEELVTTHWLGGVGTGIEGIQYGSRIDPVVNLHDSDSRGNFDNDWSFPGIDALEHPTVMWDDGSGNGTGAAGDDDNQFATLVTGCIQLTQGLHVIGANSDDGTIIVIGGVEIGRTDTWKGSSDVDFLFTTPANGYYSLRVLSLEGGGGASLELSEVLASGVRVLLGDVANGASPVFVPEPATIALLGFGGLAMLRVRRKH